MNHIREADAGVCCDPRGMKVAQKELHEPMESVRDLMASTNAMGRDVMIMAERIHGYLFGLSSEDGERKDQGSDCLQDELARHRKTLEQTARVLTEISIRLGM